MWANVFQNGYKATLASMIKHYTGYVNYFYKIVEKEQTDFVDI